MTDRYAVRRTSDGFGVWDAAVNGWHGARDLEEAEAVRLADAMNAEESGESPARRFAGPARRVEPPKRVLVHLEDGWSSGSLDGWTREPDGWYGRVRLDAGGPVTWYPAAVLRPAAP